MPKKTVVTVAELQAGDEFTCPLGSEWVGCWVKVTQLFRPQTTRATTHVVVFNAKRVHDNAHDMLALDGRIRVSASIKERVS